VLLVVKVRTRRRERFQRSSLVGGLAALVVAGFVWQERATPDTPLPTPRVAVATPTAQVSRPEQQILPDGSTVDLRSGALIEVHFDQDFRRVRLVRGEAHFQVTKDPARPFIVEAAGVKARAVGTAFLVQLRGEQVEVIVTEGNVQVEGPNPRAGEALPVMGPGEGTIVSLVKVESPIAVEPPRVVPIATDDLIQRLAWRAPHLEFSGTPLAEAIPMINAHNRVQLVLGDASLGDVRLSGILRADNIEVLWLLLKEEHGIIVQPRGDNEVILQKGR